MMQRKRGLVALLASIFLSTGCPPRLFNV